MRSLIVTVAVVLVALSALACLRDEGSRAACPAASTSSRPSTRPSPVVRPSSSSEEKRGEALPAMRGAALALAASRAARSEVATLERELLLVEPRSERELVDLRVSLEASVRRKPELVAAVATAFLSREGPRGLIFVLSRALVVAGDRATLLDAAREGNDFQREAALVGLAGAGDLEAAHVALDALATGTPLVKGAAAFAISQDFSVLSGREKESALELARGLARSREEPHARAEALQLLAVAPSSDERGLALSVLGEPGARGELVLAAARLAVACGEARSEVARRLVSSNDALVARAAHLLSGNSQENSPEEAR